MPAPRILIVGAGLTGCTIAHQLAQEGLRPVLLERSGVPGGLIRSEHLEGVLYEPHGSHIFHTADKEVWDLANAMTPFNDYRHRVDILADGKVLNWPILLSDIDRQSQAEEIHRQLAERKGVDAAARAQAANFEEWCLELMGPILYERYIRPYTEKQWGRPARELSAQWAPRRVSVRWDNDPYLFPDPFQGWPAGPNGYTDLIDGLLADPAIELRTGVDVDLEAVPEGFDHVVLTCPLEAFGEHRLGTGIEPQGEGTRSSRVCRIDGSSASSPTAFAEYLRIVWLTPDLDALFRGPAGDRRRFLDRLVLAVDAEHGTRVNALERALRSRNRVLEENPDDRLWLDALEREVAELAIAVAAARREAVERLSQLILETREDESPFPFATMSLEGEIDTLVATLPAVDAEDRYRAT